MRTQYESAQDRSVERHLINEFVSTEAKKLPVSYGFDFLVKNGRVSSVWEVKRRSKAYKTWFVSLLKLLKANQYESLGIEAYALVEIEKVAYKVRLTETPHYIDWGGRKDRNDSADQEPMVHYRLSDMKKLP
jgi:hypothetical protein|tara:strand:+ start:118 stop:513 length:396 start_codon:yes stop_codon:yes gene_type:complete